MGRNRTWTAVAAVSVVIAACGGSGGLSRDAGNDDDAGPVTATEFCQRVEALYTSQYMQCFGGKSTDWANIIGPSACPALAQEIEKHTVTYDPTNAKACLAELAEPIVCFEDWPARPCVRAVLTGSVADGQACENGFACQGDSECTYPPFTTNRCAVRVCQPTPTVGQACDSYCRAGASCVNNACVANLAFGARCGVEEGPCGSGLYCATDDVEPTCKRLLENGRCTNGAECFYYQFCDVARTRCSNRLELGADCSSDPGSCQSFTACDPATKRCVEASHIGQLCGNLFGYPAVCEAGGTCVFGTETNHCVDPRANGAACAQDFECLSQRCAAGTCADRPPNDGVACNDASTCTSGICSNGMCASLGPNGAPCAGGYECQSGLCTGEICTALAADGAPCSVDSQCASGSCTGGVCTSCP